MRVIHGAALAAWLLTGTVLVFGQSSPSQPVGPGVRIIQHAPKWLRFTSVTGGFNVLTPRRMAKKVEDASPGIRLSMFQTRDAGVTYFVGFTDYPEFFLLERQVPGLFESSAVSAAKRMDGKIIGKRDFKVDGKPGRETRIVSGDKKTLLVHQAVVSGSRLYQLYVETTPDEADDPDIRKFLDSFRLGLPEGKGDPVKAPTSTTGTDGKSAPPASSTGGVPVEEFYTEGDPGSVPDMKPHEGRSTVTPRDATNPIRLSERTLRARAMHRGEPGSSTVQKVQGTVVVDVLINEAGEVIATKVIRGPSELQPSAVAAAGQWTFPPFLMNGKAVKVTGTLTFHFNRGN